MGLGGLVGVPPPARLWFPHIPTFSSPQLAPEGPDIKAHPPLRTKSYMGAHPLLPKAILPTMGLLYTETWKDYADLHLPFLLDRVLVVDRGAATRGRAAWTERWDVPGEDALGDELRRRDPEGGVDGLPAWAAPFVGLDAPREWWAPARAALRSHLGLPDPADARRGKPVLTYVSMADEPHAATSEDGGRVRDEDHARLVEGLAGLQREGVLGGVHVVRGNGTRESWEERMRAIAQSSIVIGAWGGALADSVFMSPPPSARTPDSSTSSSPTAAAPILMEFFPAGTFVRDQEYAARAAGLRYAAWWDDRKFDPASLPPVMGVRAGQNPYLSVSVPAVLHDIRAEAQKLQA
ncbi:hypothetical protein EIP86_000641 [Pleurotus ostreatoroseus]|nr:hypothetical protein EIP86_000641 [Pleurotus ostreatoroseus]